MTWFGWVLVAFFALLAGVVANDDEAGAGGVVLAGVAILLILTVGTGTGL